MGSIMEQRCNNDQQALLDAQLELWHSTFAFIKSMAFKSALELGIADAIHCHGGTATLTQIATKAALHPSKTPCLRRLMRALTVAGIFSVAKNTSDDDGDQHVYGLTPASRLLVGSSQNLAPTLSLILNNVFVAPFLDLGTWFESALPATDLPLFELSHRKNVWDVVGHDPSVSQLFNAGMVADTRFLMDIAVRECGDVFQGIRSLVDVGGGHGAAAQAISAAFPAIQCTVLDLAHVVATAPACAGLSFVAGDMFEAIPPANAVFLKWIMHDWGDTECVTILKNCKKAIPPRDAGGKVIIVDTVVGAGPPNLKNKETQVMSDLFFMIVNGLERDEQEWRNIIFEAGFSDYIIIPVLGVRSIIELYP